MNHFWNWNQVSLALAKSLIGMSAFIGWRYCQDFVALIYKCHPQCRLIKFLTNLGILFSHRKNIVSVLNSRSEKDSSKELTSDLE